MKKILSILLILVMVISATACTKSKSDALLDPDKPITVTVWHYYNGNIKEAFDRLVTEFNETVGMEKGIVVDAQSQGDVNQLATAVFDAANASIGAAPMPNIFASYPDNAFRVHQIAKLTPLNMYFTEAELEKYRSEFLEEGKFITDNQYYIMPIAKSSENLYVNKDDWEAFALKHGFSSDDLSTWEGLLKVAKTYYEETGKGFYSIDANANFMLVSAKQLGEELYSYSEEGTATFSLSENVARKIWDHFYVPYIHGYYVKTGRFSSDDAKTGTVIAYTGSTAGAAYFPMTVAYSETETKAIEPLVLPYPHYEEGQKVAIQQGAGMCITDSDDAHEYASALFLKWFTSADQNIRFAVSTGYYPVENVALDENLILEQLDETLQGAPAIKESIKATNVMMNTYTLYNSKPFQGSFEMRTLLETHLFNKVSTDLQLLSDKVAAGEDRLATIEALTSDEAFKIWFNKLNEEAETLLP